MKKFNLFKKDIIKWIGYLIVLLVIIFLVKYVYKYNREYTKREFSKKLKLNSRSLLPNNYLNLNKPIYKNNEYKDNITCYNAPGPKIKDGIRVNYYNAGKSLLL